MNDNADEIDRLLDQAQALDSIEAAMPLYERMLALAPDHPVVHYNLGLVYKYRGAWTESLRHNRRASELRADEEAAHWNMGIAATALRDWPTARVAWRRAGIEIPDGDGPIEENFGPTPVRLNPDASAEVVWATRIDPVRAVIDNIPLGSSGFRSGDVVLHDGAAVGERQSNGHVYPVFNVLELFEASAKSTYEAEVATRDADDLAALTQALTEAKVDHEVWTSNMRTLCKACSEGLPHAHGKDDPKPGWPATHLVGVSTNSPDIAREVLTRWSTGGEGFLSRLVKRANGERLLRFQCALAGSPVH